MRNKEASRYGLHILIVGMIFEKFAFSAMRATYPSAGYQQVVTYS